jgi:photosystem II stability/assembly factor-like uncharacterized protein
MYQSVRHAAAMLLAMSMLCGPLSVRAEVGSARLNLLSAPSPINSRASSAVLLTVARAGDRLVAAGELGIVLLSDDNGKSWRQAQVPVSVALTRVRFLTPKLGWAVGHGGVVLQSKDGGQSWAMQLNGEQAAQIELQVAHANTGRAGSEQELANAERLVADGPDKPFFDIYFTDELHGVVIGAFGLIYGTSDGGKSWASLRTNISNPQGKHLYELHGVGNEVFLVGEQGAVYRADKALRTFSEIKTPYRGTFFGITSSANGLLIAYGLRGNVFRSADRGSSWQAVNVGMPVTVTAGALLGDGKVLLADETGRLLLSSDNGNSFRALAIANTFSFTGLAQDKDGGIVLSGVRGVMRVNAAELAKAEQK